MNSVAPDAIQLGIEKLDVELGVVNNDLGVLYELEQVVDDVTELRFVFEKLPVDAMHCECAFIALALGIDVLVKPPLGNSAADDLDRADLDNAVPIFDFEPGGLGIEYDHRVSGTPRLMQILRGLRLRGSPYIAYGCRSLGRNLRSPSLRFSSAFTRRRSPLSCCWCEPIHLPSTCSISVYIVGTTYSVSSVPNDSPPTMTQPI